MVCGESWDILVAVRDEKVRLQLAHVQLNLSNTMGTIDDTQNPLFATDPHEPFKRKPNPGIAHNSIKHRRANLESLLAGLLYNLTKTPFQFIFRNGVLKPHLTRLERTMFLQRDNALLDSAIDGLEVDQGFARLEIEIIEHRRDAGCGVLDEDTLVLRGIEQFCDICACCVEVFRVLLPDVGIWSDVGEILEGSLGVADWCWVCAEGAWLLSLGGYIEWNLDCSMLTVIQVLVGCGEEPMFEHWLSEWGGLVDGHGVTVRVDWPVLSD